MTHINPHREINVSHTAYTHTDEWCSFETVTFFRLTASSLVFVFKCTNGPDLPKQMFLKCMQLSGHNAYTPTSVESRSTSDTCTGTEIIPLPTDFISIPARPRAVSLPYPPITAGLPFHPACPCKNVIPSHPFPENCLFINKKFPTLAKADVSICVITERFAYERSGQGMHHKSQIQVHSRGNSAKYLCIPMGVPQHLFPSPRKPCNTSLHPRGKPVGSARFP